VRRRTEGEYCCPTRTPCGINNFTDSLNKLFILRFIASLCRRKILSALDSPQILPVKGLTGTFSSCRPVFGCLGSVLSPISLMMMRFSAK
jgi:hypothetical protein